MPSFVWKRGIDDAWNEPYEYECQEQFHREAAKVLEILKAHYSQNNMKYGRDETTLDKAIWLLQVDALDALIDALVLTQEKRHRIVARLFRDTVETMDLSAYFYLAGDKAKTDLEKWYKNEVIPHRISRKFIYESNDKAKYISGLYSDLSKFTHRTYNAITKSYSLGRGNKIVYDSFFERDYLVLPHVISFSYAFIAILIKRFIGVVLDTNQINQPQVDKLWVDALEKETVPRRFGIGPEQMRRIKGKIEWEHES